MDKNTIYVQKEEAAAAIERRLNKILKAEFGDEAHVATGTYTETEIRAIIKIQFYAAGEAQKANMRQQFERIGQFLGLVPSDYDLPLLLREAPVALERIEPERRKYPFIVRIIRSGALCVVGPDIFLAARARAASLAAE